MENTEKPTDNRPLKEPIEPIDAEVTHHVRGAITTINRPWLLITIPVLIGGIWLVNNTWVITNNLDKPYMLLAGPALVGSILVCIVTLTFFKAIASWCSQAWRSFSVWRKQDGSTFWMVIAIFLAVSVGESGTYFNSLLGSNDLFGTLGYASAFVIDLVAVECMRARLGAVRMRDKTGGRLYLFGVIACAGLSAWANTYTALMHFARPEGTLLPVWMTTAAPWTGMAFPLLIIFLSFSADYTADQTSSKLDPESYRKSEDNRLKMLGIQRDMLKSRVEIESEIDQLSGKSSQEHRTWFFMNWFRPKDPLEMDAVVAKVVDDFKDLYEPQLKALTEQNTMLQSQIAQFVQEAKTAYNNLGGSFTQQIIVIQDQHEVDNHLLIEQISRIEHTHEGTIEALYQFLNQTNKEMITSIQSQLNQALIAMQSESNMFPSSDNLTTNTSNGEGYQDDNLSGSSRNEREKKEGNSEPDEVLNEVIINYPIVERWLTSGLPSITIEQIIRETGHSAQLVRKREKDGAFKRTRREGYYRVDSVIKWLKTERLPKPKTVDTTNKVPNSSDISTDIFDGIPTEIETITQSNPVQNTDPIPVLSNENNLNDESDTSENEVSIAVSNGHANVVVNLDQFVEMSV